ncbi:MAG: carboxypeptidase-like regulatory domain-containing protein, partial [Candidatus Thermoplasmatota archaeon]|nr:carboxypeptidase-like regulatory domain-containing protein [Candidatus Thermoplasmatota archaeon]
MRTTTAIVICALLLASAALIFVPPSAEADGWAPEITNVIRSQKYPMEAEVVTFNATVTDSDVITDVSMFICFLGTCDLRTMSDPDGDSVYGTEYEMHTGVDWADIQISATDEFFNNNLTDKEYFPIVHWINLTADATPSHPVINDQFWVNGTAVYDENNSAPAEQSLVKLEILETAEEWTTNVDSNGDYSFALVAPSVHGSYSLNITVTNRTMAANVPLPLDVADIDTDGDGTPN